VALSFLYVAFVRLLQLVRLCLREQEELAVEVVKLRHDVSVLRHQVARPALQPRDRTVLAAFSRHFREPRLLARSARPLTPRRTPSGVGMPLLLTPSPNRSHADFEAG
jgi:hypothetical protein